MKISKCLRPPIHALPIALCCCLHMHAQTHTHALVFSTGGLSKPFFLNTISLPCQCQGEYPYPVPFPVLCLSVASILPSAQLYFLISIKFNRPRGDK